MEWDGAFDRDCIAFVQRLVAETDDSKQREAWQQLLRKTVESIERWIGGSWLLARYRLDGEDDVRAVLVAVLERLRKDDFANLRAFLASAPAEPVTDEQAAVIWAARFDAAEREQEDLAESEVSSQGRTPLRGWLLTLVRYSVADHVRQRVGWAQRRDGRPGSKRDLGTNAQRLADLPASGVRPPVTDYLRLRRFMDEVARATSDFPPPMLAALRGWLEGRGFAELATLEGIEDIEHARKLVRAGTGRIRARLRPTVRA